jgi:hypothetical protein
MLVKLCNEVVDQRWPATCGWKPRGRGSKLVDKMFRIVNVIEPPYLNFQTIAVHTSIICHILSDQAAPPTEIISIRQKNTLQHARDFFMYDGSIMTIIGSIHKDFRINLWVLVLVVAHPAVVSLCFKYTLKWLVKKSGYFSLATSYPRASCASFCILLRVNAPEDRVGDVELRLC